MDPRDPFPIINALMDGDFERARRAITTGSHDLNRVDCEVHMTPLTAVAKSMRTIPPDAELDALGVMTLLLDHNADPNLEDAHASGWHETPLSASAVSGSIEMARLLLSRNADVNAYTNGSTALICAATGSKATVAPMMAFLLQNNASVDATSASGWTAIMSAAQHGETEVIRLLLSHGASVEIEDPEGRTAASIALEAKHPMAYAILDPVGARCAHK